MRTLIIIALFIFSTPSYGCICWNDSFPLTYLNRNDTLPTNQQHYIIKGIVIDNQIGSKVYNRFGHGNLVNIKVLEYWPKDAIMNDTITIMNDESDCASGFIQDSTYLIGAWNSNRYLATSECEGTGLFSEFENVIDSLGEGGIPKSLLRNNKKSKSEKNDLRDLETNWTESIIISIIASAFFGIAVFLMRWYYFKYWLFRKVVGKYYRYYEGENEDLKNQLSATAVVSFSAMNELVVTVTTLINEDESLAHKDHYLFPPERIQKWAGKITMVNSESGSLYYYYIEGIEEKFRSHFKRVLFNPKLRMIKLFDDDRTLKPEILEKK